MARYTGPRVRISRRFGTPIFGPSKYLERKNYGPGMHGPKSRRKNTDYALGLIEKQKLRHHYGMLEKQFRRFMDIAGGLVMAGILTWSLPKAYEYVTFMKVERTSYIQLPFDLVFSIYLPFAVSIIVRLLLNVWHAIRGDSRYVDPLEAAGADDRI